MVNSKEKVTGASHDRDGTHNNQRKTQILIQYVGRLSQSEAQGKGRLLDEMRALTGIHPKSLIRILTGRVLDKKRNRECGRIYGTAVEDAVRVFFW